MALKESIHQLVDELPESELSTALRFLQYLKDVGQDEPTIQTVDPDSYGYEYEYGDDPLNEEGEGLSVADAWRQYLSGKERF